MAINISDLKVPSQCLADFSLVPINCPTNSFSGEIAKVQRLMEQAGIKHKMHATGTTVEGSWQDVVQTIGLAHSLVHQDNIGRIQTDIRIITSMDKAPSMDAAVTSVENILSK